MFYILSFIFFFTGFVTLLFSLYILTKDDNKPISKNINNNFCILIPASYESSVIGKLLESIKKQSVKIDMKNVYVIVESIKDETVDICNNFNVNVYVRKGKIHRKGYALDECIKDILKTKKYDAYFIFDADNVLDKDYIKEMTKTYKMGYNIGIGYRNCKNSTNVISACSQLTFSFVNNIGNVNRKKTNSNVIISGTGFYIDGNIIDKLKGYPFHTLTEDYELTLYSICNGLTSTINEQAIFYDEQPILINTVINQMTRWIKGFFQARKKYQLDNIPRSNNFGSRMNAFIGVKPYIYLIIGYMFLIIQETINFGLLEIFFIQLLTYLILSILTTLMIIMDSSVNIKLEHKIQAIFFNPLFLLTFIYSALKALFIKDVKWNKVKHNINKTS